MSPVYSATADHMWEVRTRLNFVVAVLAFYAFMMVTLLVLVLDLASTLSVMRGIVYLLLALTTLWSPWRYDAFVIAGGCTAITVVGFFLEPSTEELVKRMDERTLTMFALWATALMIYRRKQAEQANRRSERKYRTIFERAGDALYVVNQEGRIIDCNQNACNLFGFSREELVEKSLSDLVPAELVGPEKENLERVLRNDQEGVTTYESLALRKCGAPISVETNSTLIELEGRLHVIYFLRDIGRRKALEQRLRQTLKLEALGQLASGVAHDFNNMLSIIISRVGLMDSPDISEKFRTHLGVISKSAFAGARMVKRLQGFARRREVQRKDIVHIHGVISDVIEMAHPRWEYEAEKNDVSIQVMTEAHASVDTIRGDDSELQEALINLVNNALDAMPEGGRITLSTENRPGEVVLSVLDTGIGMDPETLARAMEPFFTTKTERGTGLGLSMVYGIVGRHGGRLDLESTPGQGTAVHLTFPLATDAELSSQRPQERMEPEEKPMSPRGSVRFLVIDDESEIVEALIGTLTQAGYEAEGTTDPEEGLAKFAKGGFGFVVTDLGMPGVSGWEVAKEIRKAGPDVPIILITGWAGELEKERLDSCGINRVISKPFKQAEILEAIEDILANGITP